MRPFITILIVVCLIGGMYGYLKFTDTVKRPDANHQTVSETKEITVEIKRSSTLFADSDFDIVALKVEFKDQMVTKVGTDIPAHDTVVVTLPNVESGLNTVNVLGNFDNPQQFLSSSMPPSLFAMEVIVRADQIEIARQLFSSSSSALPVGGQVSFDTL